MSKRPKTKHYKIQFDASNRGHCIGDFEPGEVFVRHGTPHVRVTVMGNPSGIHQPENGKAWICNLSSGSVWQIDESESVVPAVEPKLTYLRTDVTS